MHRSLLRRMGCAHRRFAALGGAALLAVAGALPAAALTEGQAVAAVERFIAAWNTGDPAQFAATLHYPHARPSAGGGGEIYDNAAAYAATIDFDEVRATGWVRSALDSTRVVHLGAGRAHVAGQYARYRADGSRIFTTQVLYVVTESSGSIGIQARFAAGPVLESAAERDAAAKAAIGVVEAYMAAFNARDEQAWADTLNYPHLRLAPGPASPAVAASGSSSGDTTAGRVEDGTVPGGTITPPAPPPVEVRTWSDREAYVAEFDFDAFASRYDWARSEWDAIEAVQVSANGVNVALRATRRDREGKPLSTFDTLYLVTRENGRWGVRARSSFAPTVR
jgi:hypothetical protein